MGFSAVITAWINKADSRAKRLGRLSGLARLKFIRVEGPEASVPAGLVTANQPGANFEQGDSILLAPEKRP